MRTWLKRMVAVIVSAGTLLGGGLLTAGTANADEIRMPDIGKTITSTARTIAGKSGSLPTELVNGSFSYKGRQCLDTARKAAGNDYQSDWNFANIDYVKGDAGAARKWAHIDGFQATGFGWKSNQTDTAVDGRAPHRGNPAVEGRLQLLRGDHREPGQHVPVPGHQYAA